MVVRGFDISLKLTEESEGDASLRVTVVLVRVKSDEVVFLVSKD
jgi:hypothetical protein